MNRWIEHFKNHPFQAQWEKVKGYAEAISSIKKNGQKEIEEYARLRKIIKYIDDLLEAIDPLLVPQDVWDNFNKHASSCFDAFEKYKDDNDIIFLQKANKSLDKILECIAPYVVSGKNAAKAAGQAFRVYANIVSQQLKLQEFEGNEEDSLQNRIKTLVKKIEEWHGEASDYMIKLTGSREEDGEEEEDDDEEQTNIMSEIENAKNAINDALEAVEEKVNEFKNYHSVVFGVEAEDGTIDGGLEQELVKRQQELTEYDTTQKATHAKIYSEIDILLSGTTGVTLAGDYGKRKEESEAKADKYEKQLIISLYVLFLVALTLFIDGVGWLYIDFIDFSNIRNWLPSLIFKLPLLTPLAGISAFLYRARTQAYRLQHEYAHKEALAKSYYGFKQQLERLDDKSQELTEKLLEAAIDTIEFNASKTLDKDHRLQVSTQKIDEKPKKFPPPAEESDGP